MKRRYDLRAFAYCRSDALNRARAHITDSKYPRLACLQGVPAPANIRACQYEALAVQCYTGS